MKIPKDAKKVFSGVIFDVYHWDQEMFDGSTQTFERLKRANSIMTIPTCGDKIYIPFEQQSAQDHPVNTIFGGRQNAGETVLECAKRELLEESGFASEDFELFKIYEPYSTKIEWEVHIYIARNCKKITEQKLDPGEKIEIKEVTFDEFIDIVSMESFCAKELTIDILKMKIDGTLDEFKKKLFG